MLETSSTVAWIWVSGISGVKMKTLVPKFGALVDHPGGLAWVGAGDVPRNANMPPIKAAMIKTRTKICPVYKVIFSPPNFSFEAARSVRVDDTDQKYGSMLRVNPSGQCYGAVKSRVPVDAKNSNGCAAVGPRKVRN